MRVSVCASVPEYPMKINKNFSYSLDRVGTLIFVSLCLEKPDTYNHVLINIKAVYFSSEKPNKRDRQKTGQTDRPLDVWTNRQTGRLEGRQAGGLTGWQLEKQAGGQASRHKDRQTDVL
jgi:hypothetical protein